MRLSIKLLLLLVVNVYISLQVSAQSTELVYLSGTGVDKQVEWDFYCTAGRNSGEWTKIPVPSCWEQEGFGVYNYGHAKDEERLDEKGLYRFQFSVPKEWNKKQVEIVFQGVMTDANVKVNGKSAGVVHQGAYYQFQYDISKLLKYGQQNQLEVTVAKHSNNESVKKAEGHGDYWIFGGIYRPVYLEAKPEQNIERVAIDAKADGEFTADVFLTSVSSADAVKAQIYSLEGQPVGVAFFTELKKGADKVQLHAKLNGVEAWNAEYPKLYQVKFELQANGNTVHENTTRFGFRTVEIRQRDGVYVNGVKVKFKGVNRHTFRAQYGRASSKVISIEDVELIKSMNMNAVRMSHYPPDSHFLEVCDSLGLFVLDELTGWHATYDNEVGPKLVKEMVTRDVNHPSILMWDNGNEGGHNPAFDELFTQYDIQKRLVIYPWMEHNGLATQHYRGYDYGAGTFWNGRLITMPTEFLHGMYDGGHGASLYDYWEYIWNKPKAAGGFLWDLFDQGILRTDKEGEVYDTDGNHGADGIVGPKLEREGSYFAIKKIWCPVRLEDLEITPTWEKKIGIENRYIYTNLNECNFSYKLQKLPLPGQMVIQTVETGSIPVPDLNPGAKGQLVIPLSENWADFDVLEITATDRYGKELYTWSYPLHTAGEVASNLVESASNSDKLSLTEGDDAFVIQAAKNQFSISKNNGMLQQVKNEEGIIPFNQGPSLSAGVTAFKNVEARTSKDSIVLISSFETGDADSSRMKEFTWTFYPNGWAKLHIYYFPPVYDVDFDLMGVDFSYPEELVEGVEWLGNGPYRVWKNRMQGAEFGLHQKAYNNTITGVSPIIYPEFKGYHSNLYWAKIQSKEQSFTVATSTDDVFLRLYTPAQPDPFDPRVVPAFPGGDISFMQAIPAIGTKCNEAWNMGPAGQKNKFFDYGPFDDWRIRSQQMTLYFNFSSNQ
ncbi:glycoside hydrolase family 2 TIM barrel-domain containing protein [Mangrovibacterium lignilyticum]|uniref:glycoside hydrolase family 2 TIM barrel-domain containing protein n=1 Tax=Mangrovibacterium lignilyticum TaxID=2668052 RepID=UPI0013D6CF0A|nr:glycoside hydrolase family 2 TIM barrel-domain containing protein [Mangrovibacterium lignilyticum]